MSKLIDTHISKCKNWDEFVSLVNNQSENKFKGALFERLTQVFLKTCSPYASKLWDEFVKTSDGKSDIPKSPWIDYKNKGWISQEDWLTQP